MTRKLFTFLPALFLLLFMATVLMWVRSYCTADYLIRTTIEDGPTALTKASDVPEATGTLKHRCVESFRGKLAFAWTSFSYVGIPAALVPWDEPVGIRYQRHSGSYLGLPIDVTYLFDGPVEESGDNPYSNQFPSRQLMGFRYRSVFTDILEPGPLQTRRLSAYTVIALPYWLLAILTAVPPSLWLIGSVKRLRTPIPGFCRGCGYDLTANVSGTCPECGTVAPARAAEDTTS